MTRTIWAALLVLAAVVFAKSYKNTRNDLSEHIQETEELDQMQKVSTGVSNLVLDQWPLTTVGELPLTAFDYANWQFGTGAEVGDTKLYPRSIASVESDPQDFIDTVENY